MLYSYTLSYPQSLVSVGLPPVPSQSILITEPVRLQFAVLSLPYACTSFGHSRNRDGNWFMHIPLVLTSMHALLHQFACCYALLEYAYEVPATLLHPIQLTL